MKGLSRRLLSACVALLTSVGTVAAHELPENRATVVLRDKNHVSITLRIDLVSAMQRALAGKQPLPEFILTHGAMSGADFRRVYDLARGRFERDTQLTLPSAPTPLAATWRWPDAASLHALLREQAMRQVTDPAVHAHGDAVEISLDARAERDISAINLKLPVAWQPVVVVSYRPTQARLNSPSGQLPIRF